LSRLNTAKRGTALAEMFVTSTASSLHKKVMRNNMDKDSFMDNKKDGLELLLTKPKQVFFNHLEQIFGYEEFKCKVT
jgi:hypothetical protein